MDISISVVLATFNGEAFIQRQLHSIVPYLRPSDEIIVCDDASDDLTINYLHSFMLSYPQTTYKTIVQPFRVGPCRNFEIALSHASNDLIVLSDQDDIWFPNKIDLLRELSHTYSLITSNSYSYFKCNQNFYDSFALHQPSSNLLANLIKPAFIGCHIAFKRELLQYLLPFPKTAYMHDMLIGILFIIFRRRSLISDLPTMLYIRHDNVYTPQKTSLLRKLSLRLRYLLTYLIILSRVNSKPFL